MQPNAKLRVPKIAVMAIEDFAMVLGRENWNHASG
jgi:hypothetical protein